MARPLGLTCTDVVPRPSPVCPLAAIPRAVRKASRLAQRPRNGSALTRRTWPRQLCREGTGPPDWKAPDGVTGPANTLRFYINQELPRPGKRRFLHIAFLVPSLRVSCILFINEPVNRIAHFCESFKYGMPTKHVVPYIYFTLRLNCPPLRKKGAESENRADHDGDPKLCKDPAKQDHADACH
jgi:hypothetical protein